MTKAKATVHIFKMKQFHHSRANRFDVLGVVVQLSVDVTTHGSFCSSSQSESK